MNRPTHLTVLGGIFALGVSLSSHHGAPALPLTQQGVLHGAPDTIKLPANWNGTLVVYAHGYRAVPNKPGKVEDDTAYPAPSPIEDPSEADVEPYLLARGYGLAGSAFRAQDYNIQEGIEGTQELMAHFRDAIGKLRLQPEWGETDAAGVSGVMI